MSSIHETAYPRFKPELTQRELEDVYTPNEGESKFIHRKGRTGPARLYLALLLKTVQRLGYFPMLHEVPVPVVSFIGKTIGVGVISARDLLEEEKRHHSRERGIEAVRQYVGIGRSRAIPTRPF